MVIIEAELSIGSPDIRRFPVVDGISVEYVVAYFGSPPVIMIHLVFPVQMNTAPAVEALLCTNSYKKAGAYRIFPQMQPFGKVHLIFVIPHILRIKRKSFFGIGIGRHLAHPKLFHAFIPWTPIALIHRGAGGDLERYTYAIYFQNILISLQYTVYIVYGHSILYLIIHVKYT